MKQITLLITLLVCSIGFSQSSLSSYVEQNPNYAQQGTANQTTSVDANRQSTVLAPLGLDSPVYYRDLPTVDQDPVAIRQEILAYENSRAAQTDTNAGAYLPAIGNQNFMADIIPTAGATETFFPNVGDNFFDPGGPGGSSTGGTPGNYPNCGCTTLTTLSGVTEVDFLFFSVFATFDWLRIYDSVDTSGTVLYDNSTGGANQGDITLADMIASNGSGTFTGTSGSLTFEFFATTVVDYGGWDAEIIAASGGGGCIVEDFETYNPPAGGADVLGTMVLDENTIANGQGPGLVEDGCVYSSLDGDLQWNDAGYFGQVSRNIVANGADGTIYLDYDDPVDSVDFNVSAFDGFADTVTAEAFDMGGGSLGVVGPLAVPDSAPVPVSFAVAGIKMIVVTGTQPWSALINDHVYCPAGGGGGGGCAPGVYADRASFQAEAGVLTFEDFAGGPGGISACGEVISSAGGPCFPAGEIQPGVEITIANPPNTTVYVEAGNFSLPFDAVGSNTFVDFTIINFPNMDVNSFAFDLFGLIGGATIDIRIFGTGGLITTETVVAGDPNGVFFGYIATETVVSVELEDLSGSTAELIAQLEFGECVAGGACVVAQYDATGLPADIDPGGTSTPDCVNMPNLYPVTVGDPGTIGVDSNIDNVTISITHTFDGDLDISLVAPSGAELLLSGGNGGSGDNFIDTVFMDGAGPLSGGAPPYTGTFEPDGGTFAVAFDGEDILGDWNLKVCDNFGGDTGTVDAFSISICRPDPPSNEECIDAFPVVCGEVVVGTTADNTDNGGFNAAPDEWYSFTGTGSPQIVTVSLCDGGTTYDSRLTVYDVCGGTEIITNDDFCGLQSQLTFLSDGTTTYYIAIEGFSAGNSGPFSMEITCVDPPPNDECPGAISMDCGDTVVGETITASFDATAPVCVTGITAPGVWYEFTDTTGLVTNYTLSMCDGGTDYDSKITVYSGDCGALVCVVDNDDSCGLQSEVSWQGDGLTTYLILVHGFGSSVGNFSMALTCAPVPPPNDMIVNSIDVDEIGFPYTDPAVAMPAATTENGNPVGCNLDGANGVWYNFVPDADGYATAEIITPGGASAVTFYTAPDENSMETDLTLVDWQGNQCVPGTSAIIPTTAGQAYYVFVLNNGAITDIVIDGEGLGADDNTIQGFTYYPNPTDGVLNLNAVESIDNVAIYNLLGQQVLNHDIDATSTALDVSRLAVGAYLMKVSVNGQIGTYKIIKR